MNEHLIQELVRIGGVDLNPIIEKIRRDLVQAITEIQVAELEKTLLAAAADAGSEEAIRQLKTGAFVTNKLGQEKYVTPEEKNVYAHMIALGLLHGNFTLQDVITGIGDKDSPIDRQE